MTPEQLAQFNTDTTSLKLSPEVWGNLSTEENESMVTLLTPTIDGYNSIQYTLFQSWVLAVTEQQLIDLNVIADDPSYGFVINPRIDVNGNRFIGLDLIQESILTSTWEDLAPIIATLPITYKSTEEWPPIED